jgi:hypothetical protein
MWDLKPFIIIIIIIIIILYVHKKKVMFFQCGIKKKFGLNLQLKNIT